MLKMVTTRDMKNVLRLVRRRIVVIGLDDEAGLWRVAPGYDATC
jgi:hypothetical protein